ncbi:MAG: DUF4190 domain-containing protein [Actinobacteria bacterium]|nr:DUF4190 domain-containing protein [Actinomycetota bacterium]
MSYPAAEYPQQAQQEAPYASQAVAPPVPTTLAYTNTYALVSIITAFLSPIAAIVFGHLALGQIKRTGDAGRGLALTGLIIGYAYFAMAVLFVVVYIGFIGLMFASMGAVMGQAEGIY